MNGISHEEARRILALSEWKELLPFLIQTQTVRETAFGNGIAACAILNAKSGCCTENCAFCPQSVFASTHIDAYPLMSVEEIAAAAEKAQADGAVRFGIVTSGRTIDDPEELKTLCSAVRTIRAKLQIKVCGSLGILTFEQLCELKAAGLDRYHHNLETAGSYYAQICTTRTYDDQLRTVRDAQRAGLTVCSGGIFGLGETPEQRLELFETLRELKVDSIPVNFLHPMEGTRMGGRSALSAFECLKIVVTARLMLPETRIRICGGRERNLRDLQSWLFAAGADSVMIGNYLTTQGRTLENDLRLFSDLNLEIVRD